MRIINGNLGFRKRLGKEIAKAFYKKEKAKFLSHRKGKENRKGKREDEGLEGRKAVHLVYSDLDFLLCRLRFIGIIA